MEPNTFSHNGSPLTLGNTSGTIFTGLGPSTNYNPPGTSTISSTTGIIANPHYSQSLYLTPQNIIMQNKVAVFKVTRDEDNKITDTKFVKELWVQTKNNQSVEFQVARDKDLADYDANDLIIKTIHTVTF